MANPKKESGPTAPAGSSTAPGDNRTADDVDGNRSGGDNKARGVKEPDQPSDDNSTERNS